MRRIHVLHGPNLNLLGSREPGVYGSLTLAELDAALRSDAETLGVDLTIGQRNGEGELVELVHAARGADGIVINPGGYTHTSVALRDALLAVGVPFIEVHLTNVYAREPFRHVSLLRDVAAGVIVGLGARGYRLALRAFAEGVTDA